MIFWISGLESCNIHTYMDYLYMYTYVYIYLYIYI